MNSIAANCPLGTQWDVYTVIGSDFPCFFSSSFGNLIINKNIYRQRHARLINEIYDNQNCNTYGMKEVKSKGIAPMQGIYAKLQRMAPFCLYFVCTRGINLFKYHLNKFRVTCTGVYCVVRLIPSINPYRLHLENPHYFLNVFRASQR